MTLLAKLTLTAAIIVPLALAVAVRIAYAQPRDGSPMDKAGELSLCVAVYAVVYAFTGGVILALEAVWD